MKETTTMSLFQEGTRVEREGRQPPWGAPWSRGARGHGQGSSGKRDGIRQDGAEKPRGLRLLDLVQEQAARSEERRRRRGVGKRELRTPHLVVSNNK